MVNIYLLPCHIGQFSKSIKDVALLDFGQFEKLPLKDRVVQIQTQGLMAFLVHLLTCASKSSKLVSSGGFSSAQAIASLRSALTFCLYSHFSLSIKLGITQ